MNIMFRKRIVPQMAPPGFANRVRFTRHAWERMDERGVTERDVLHALKSAASCFAQTNGTWKVPSKDTAGDDLSAVVALVDEALVVTLF